MTQELLNKNSTAFYVFDIGTLRRRIELLKSKLPENVSLCYAVKANTFIIKDAAQHVERLEVCSPGEELICRKLGIPSEKVVISGVYKTPEFIESLVADPEFNGIFTVESQLQYEMLCRFSEKYNHKLTLLLRLTNASQFGVSKKKIKRMIAEREQHKYINIAGIQYFSGTQKSSIKKLRREIEHLDAFLIELKDELDFASSELEYGTGFPVAYFDDEELNEQELLEEFSSLLMQMESSPKITLEVGRSIAASCGKYYTHIVDKKTNKGQNYLLIDGGMHHIVYFGQHMAMKHPKFSIFGKESMPKKDQWNICGSLCSMNDIIAKQVELPEFEIGDTIVFENTGAYCMTEGISLFLSRDIPAVYLITEDGKAVRVRDTIETAELNLPRYEI